MCGSAASSLRRRSGSARRTRRSRRICRALKFVDDLAQGAARLERANLRCSSRSEIGMGLLPATADRGSRRPSSVRASDQLRCRDRACAPRPSNSDLCFVQWAAWSSCFSPSLPPQPSFFFYLFFPAGLAGLAGLAEAAGNEAGEHGENERVLESRFHDVFSHESWN